MNSKNLLVDISDVSRHVPQHDVLVLFHQMDADDGAACGRASRRYLGEAESGYARRSLRTN